MNVMWTQDKLTTHGARGLGCEVSPRALDHGYLAGGYTCVWAGIISRLIHVELLKGC